MPSRKQYRAWYAVKQAIRTGLMERPESCEHCGKAPGVSKRGRSLVQAHHFKGYDYINRLTVMFLCPKCHRRADERTGPRPTNPVAIRVIANLRALKAQREAATT